MARTALICAICIVAAVGLASCSDDGSPPPPADSQLKQEATPPPPTGEIGSPCEKDADCDYKVCLLTRGSGVFPDGYCSRSCDGTTDPCPDGAFCLSTENGNCFKPCSDPSQCRQGYACTQAPGAGSPKICFPE